MIPMEVFWQIQDGPHSWTIVTRDGFTVSEELVFLPETVKIQVMSDHNGSWQASMGSLLVVSHHFCLYLTWGHMAWA